MTLSTISDVNDPRVDAILSTLTAAVPLRPHYRYGAAGVESYGGSSVVLTVDKIDGGPRCSWLDCSIGDLATFIDRVRADSIVTYEGEVGARYARGSEDTCPEYVRNVYMAGWNDCATGR